MGQDRLDARLRRRRRPGRMDAGLVALSAAAILSVYAVGYIHTGAESTAIDALPGPPSPTPASTRTPALSVLAPATPTAESFRTAESRTAPSPMPTSEPTATPTPRPVYVDGSYVSVGVGHHGSMEVTVVVSEGRLISADVTDCRMQYPCVKIKKLMRRAVELQQPPTDYISGATDSAAAYFRAVAGALEAATQPR